MKKYFIAYAVEGLISAISKCSKFLNFRVKKSVCLPVQYKREYKTKDRQIFAANCREIAAGCREGLDVRLIREEVPEKLASWCKTEERKV